MPNRIYHKADYDLHFTPSGEPEKLNEEGAGKPSDEVGADKALGTLGAGIKSAKKYSSLDKNAVKIDVPKEGQETIYNRKS